MDTAPITTPIGIREDIGGVRVRDIAATFGTPIYAYDGDRIRENARRIRQAFQSAYPRSRIHYATKANPNVSILKLIRAEGLNADCASPGEVAHCLAAGFKAEEIIYTGNFESGSDLQAVANKVGGLNFDDMTTLDRYVDAVGVPTVASFRVNPGVGAGSHRGITTGGSEAKFGVPHERLQEALAKAVQLGCRRFGLHVMGGSNNRNADYFDRVSETVLEMAARAFSSLRIIPDYIDFGGGFGVPYLDEDAPLDIAEVANAMGSRLAAVAAREKWHNTALVVEPGRYIVADAGSLITRVTGTKDSYKTFVGLDAGMTSFLRPALYGARHRVYLARPAAQYRRVTELTLCGQICENTDILAKDITMPMPETGDLLVFGEAGAYCYTMSSSYNGRTRPAEVLVLNGQPHLIRRRETVEDLLAQQILL